ncbi:MAG: hypothetical protein VST68_11310 [Nitrospirota bacterium]|nr:hypothetical protein [Nitrospirota bacterium]
MEISSVDSHPALFLLQSMLQTAALATPPVSPASDDVSISDTAKVLAHTPPSEA